MNKHRLFMCLAAAGVIVSCLCFYLYSRSVSIEPLTSTEGRSFARARVTEILEDTLVGSGVNAGSQSLKVEITSGRYKGQIFDATSTDGNLFGAHCTVGMHVIVIISESDSGSLVSVYMQDRELATWGFILAFLGLIVAIGRGEGLKSVMGLVFTCAMLIFWYLPMLYQGVSPFFAAVFVCAVTTMVSMYFIGGISKKTLSAILGTIAGVCIAGIAAYIYGIAAGIDGYNVSDIESLLFVQQNSQLQVGGLLFSGILISALGAVMDVAMSISSTLCEIKAKKPEAGRMELFKSGITVGRDMMGTMSNTLILAFIGGSQSTLLINYAYNLPYLQLINSYNIGIEIMQGLSGSIGVIMTVPCVSAIGAFLIGGSSKGNAAAEETQMRDGFIYKHY